MVRDVISGRQSFDGPSGILVVVLVIEYCDLRFTCNLVLDIWDFGIDAQYTITKIVCSDSTPTTRSFASA